MVARELFILGLELLKLGGKLRIQLPQGSIGSRQVDILLLMSGDLTPQIGQPS